MSGSRRSETGWRSAILHEFSPDLATVSRLTVVADPDQLMNEQGVLEEIRAAGFDLIPFEDDVAFRYAYESRYRESWDRGGDSNLVVVLHATRDDADNLPYDLLHDARKSGRVLAFSVANLFPNFAPRIIAALDRTDYDALYRVQQDHQPGLLGETATKDFVLRHIFEIAAEQIKTPAGLLRVLLAKHYRGRTFPSLFDERFIETLEKTGLFADWPLREIVPHRERFLTFLQERWPIYLSKQVAEGKESVAETNVPFALAISGPADLPFGHSDVKVYMDNLFLEGLLLPVGGVPKERFEGTWMAGGVKGSVASDDGQRFIKLSRLIEDHVPAADAEAAGWLEAAQKWGEWSALRWTLSRDAITRSRVDVEALRVLVAQRLNSWAMAWYPNIHNLPYLPRPVMVHQVPRFMAHGWPARKRRLALVVVDGMAMSQWALLRRSLVGSGRKLAISDGAVFAWVPTITSVSRQSIFSGEPPLYFGPSIATTSKEDQHWRRFWEDRGAARGDIAYLCQKSQEPDEAYLTRVTEAADSPNCKLLGLVIGTVDEMMHGTVTGSDGLHAQVKHWAEGGHFAELIRRLHDREFEVFVTADHGNVEGLGIGKPNVGAIAEQRGERVHVFSDELTRENTAKQFPGAIVWPGVGLPQGYKPLLAPAGGAFIAAGKRTVAHGGICIEELVVPFAHIKAPA